MKMDHEEAVLRNPALGARIFWQFANAFSESKSGDPPNLPIFLIAAGMLYHRSSVQKIKGMNFESGLLKAVSDRPDIVAGLQYRIESFAHEALHALQVGVASGLLLREGGEGLPAFRATGPALPLAIREAGGHVNEMFLATKRLGNWFAAESLESLKRRLMIEF